MSNAWLITWDGAGADAQVKDKIVAILSPEKTVEEVAAITEAIYSHFTSTLEEMAAYATEKRANPYPACISANKGGGASINCGHNPYLEAYLVRNLTVEVDEKTQKETVSWEQQVFSGDWLKKSLTQKTKTFPW
jgi:hypothetical protein